MSSIVSCPRKGRDGVVSTTGREWSNKAPNQLLSDGCVHVVARLPTKYRFPYPSDNAVTLIYGSFGAMAERLEVTQCFPLKRRKTT